jgi:hypothetical protein
LRMKRDELTAPCRSVFDPGRGLVATRGE